MNRSLKNAILNTLELLKNGEYRKPTSVKSSLEYLESVYSSHMEANTETSKRIEYLTDCLESGMSKREAARKLSEHDPRVSRKTAETLVYLNFSGKYQTSRVGRRKSLSDSTATIPLVPDLIPPNIESDEDIL
jgi:hypothetical protein